MQILQLQWVLGVWSLVCARMSPSDSCPGSHLEEIKANKQNGTQTRFLVAVVSESMLLEICLRTTSNYDRPGKSHEKSDSHKTRQKWVEAGRGGWGHHSWELRLQKMLSWWSASSSFKNCRSDMDLPTVQNTYVLPTYTAYSTRLIIKREFWAGSWLMKQNLWFNWLGWIRSSMRQAHKWSGEMWMTRRKQKELKEGKFYVVGFRYICTTRRKKWKHK
jgi:hypothetical protein